MKRNLPAIPPCPELRNVNKTMIIEVPKEFRKDNQPKFRIVSSFSFLEDHTINFKADSILRHIMEKGTTGRKLESIGIEKNKYSLQPPQNSVPEEQSSKREVSYKQQSQKTAEPHLKSFGDEGSLNRTIQFGHPNSSSVSTTKHASSSKFPLPSCDEPLPVFNLVKLSHQSPPSQQQENADLKPFLKSTYGNKSSKETHSNAEPVKDEKVDKNCCLGDQVMDESYGFLPDYPGTTSEFSAYRQTSSQEEGNYMLPPNVNDEEFSSYLMDYRFNSNSRSYPKRTSRPFKKRCGLKRMQRSSNHNFGQRPKIFSGSPQQHSQFQEPSWYGGGNNDLNSEMNEQVPYSDYSSVNSAYSQRPFQQNHRVSRGSMQRISNSSNWLIGQNTGSNTTNQNDRFPPQEGQKSWLLQHLQRSRSKATGQQLFTQGVQGNHISPSDLPEHVFWSSPDLSSAKHIVFIDIRSYGNFFSEFVRMPPPELHIWTFMSQNFKLRFPDSPANNRLVHAQLLHITLGDANKLFPEVICNLHYSLVPHIPFIIITNMNFSSVDSIAEHRMVNFLSPRNNQRMQELYRILSM